MSSDESTDSSDSEFNDGYDENLMGDEEDQARLQALSEKERETELFKRSEHRDALRRRWEIKQKLLQARRDNDKSKAPKDKKKKEEKRKRREQERAEAAAAGMIYCTYFRNHWKIKSSIFLPLIEKAAADRAEALKLVLEKPQYLLENEQSVPAASAEYFDPKERSKERKKNVEMNRTDDKRSNAMAALKAKREGKLKREEEEAKRQAEREVAEDLDGGT